MTFLSKSPSALLALILSASISGSPASSPLSATEPRSEHPSDLAVMEAVFIQDVLQVLPASPGKPIAVRPTTIEPIYPYTTAQQRRAAEIQAKIDAIPFPDASVDPEGAQASLARKLKLADQLPDRANPPEERDLQIGNGPRLDQQLIKSAKSRIGGSLSHLYSLQSRLPQSRWQPPPGSPPYGWLDFEIRYGQIAGLVTFSLPGYSANGQQAALTYVLSPAERRQIYRFVVIAKSRGEWEIVYSEQLYDLDVRQYPNDSQR